MRISCNVFWSYSFAPSPHPNSSQSHLTSTPTLCPLFFSFFHFFLNNPWSPVCAAHAPGCEAIHWSMLNRQGQAFSLPRAITWLAPQLGWYGWWTISPSILTWQLAWWSAGSTAVMSLHVAALVPSEDTVSLWSSLTPTTDNLLQKGVRPLSPKVITQKL